MSSLPIIEINARDLLAVSPEEIMQRYDIAQPIRLRFDDGSTLRTNVPRTVFSRQLWDAHIQFTRIPLLKHHHIGNGIFSAAVSQKVLGRVNRDAHVAYHGKGAMLSDAPVDGYHRELLWDISMMALNQLHNLSVSELSMYIRGADFDDYLDLYHHPVVVALRESYDGSPLVLASINRKFHEFMMTNEELSDSPIIIQYRCGLLKRDQITQEFLPRGDMTDACSTVFPVPIYSTIIEGFTGYRDFLQESRMATKAYLFQENPLKIVEYFNRKAQLFASYVHTLVYEDCGSDHYLEIPIRAPYELEGRRVDILEDLKGTHYLLPDGSLGTVESTDKHLYGTVIKARSPMLCRHRHTGKVCTTCFGNLSYQKPVGDNLGWWIASFVFGKTSQLVLGVKHHENSINIGIMTLHGSIVKYANTKGPASTICFNAELAEKLPYLILPSRPEKNLLNASGLVEIRKESVDFDELNVFRITAFEKLTIGFGAGDIQFEDSIDVSYQGRLASLSRELLEYIRESDYEVLPNGNYRVDLSDWDYRQPALVLPLRHMNMLDYNSEIDAFLRLMPSRKMTALLGNVHPLSTHTDMSEALMDFYHLIKMKLDINIKHMEVLMLSLMAGTDRTDFNIPPLGMPHRFIGYRQALTGRSLGSGLAYQDMDDSVRDPSKYAYVTRNRMWHPMDAMITIGR